MNTESTADSAPVKRVVCCDAGKFLKVYRQIVLDHDVGYRLNWSTSRRGAIRVARELVRQISKDGGRAGLLGEPREFLIPKTKRGLVAWLNTCVDGARSYLKDNG